MTDDRCGWLPKNALEELNKPGMLDGDRRAWSDRNGCREVAVFMIQHEFGYCDEAKLSCSAHLGEMCMPGRHVVVSPWPDVPDEPAVGEIAPVANGRVRVADSSGALMVGDADEIVDRIMTLATAASPGLALLAELDKWAGRNPSTAKVTYVKPEAADSKDDATDPFIKIDRIELATKDPKRWLTELDAKVERSAAMTRTQVAFNCLQWTNQHTRVTVSNDRVYVEADANHYLECMPVDVARIAGLHLAAFPWTVRINLGPAAHVIYRSEDGGGKEWRPRSPDHIKKAFSEIPWVTGVEVTGSHSSHSHGTGSVMVALGAKESGLPRYTEELESEVTRVANRAIEVGVPWTVMITFEHGGRMAFSSERYGRVS